MWFSVGYSLIDNDTRHHSGQNVVDLWYKSTKQKIGIRTVYES